MPQLLFNIIVYLVFSTKARESFIDRKINLFGFHFQISSRV